jgi:quercetin dioxygenase-like cupin family protein
LNGYFARGYDAGDINWFICEWLEIEIAPVFSERHGNFSDSESSKTKQPRTELPMPFVDVSSLKVIERLPGWHGRYFHSSSMTFAHYDFKRGSSIHEHSHAQEEVYEVVEGELEVTIDGVAEIARSGLVAIVPSNARHSVKALTDGRAIIVDYPLRRELSG